MALHSGSRLREEATGEAETLSLLTLDGDRKVTPFLRTRFNHRNADLSPKGRWLAYESDESGHPEVYVRPFPNTDRGRWPVSTTGGWRPVWARNGRELFYQAPDGAVLGVQVTADGDDFRAGTPAKFVAAGFFMGAANQSGRTYDVSPDGQRFLMIKDAPSSQTPQLVLIENWFEELKRLVPTP